MSFATREAWLEKAKEDMAAWFGEIGKKFPANVAVSCGWPSVAPLAESKRRIGEAWASECSKRKTFELFISPWIDKPAEVLAVLLHEMVHASAGLACKHRGEFKRQAIELGLTGKMTATVPGPLLLKRLNALAKMLGTYPHRSLDKMTTGRKKAGTRLLKAECECGYVVRVTRKWADQGAPLCGVCETRMTIEGEEAEED